MLSPKKLATLPLHSELATLLEPPLPDAPVSPFAPLGIPKFKVYSLLLSDIVTVALFPASSVVTEPTLNVGVIPSCPLTPSAPVAPVSPLSPFSSDLCSVT